VEPRITLITLAVTDLERALAFYRDGLGWPTEGIVGQDPDGHLWEIAWNPDPAFAVE
jgi:predicted lactoylglutathione lyase